MLNVGQIVHFSQYISGLSEPGVPGVPGVSGVPGVPGVPGVLGVPISNGRVGGAN